MPLHDAPGGVIGHCAQHWVRATPRSAVLRLLASALELYGQELGLLPAVCDPLGVNVSLSFVEDFPPVVERKVNSDVVPP